MRDGAADEFSHQDSDEFLALIRAAQGGCKESMDRLIRDCQPYLLAIANDALGTKLSPKVGASDVVQNSILSAQRCIADFNGESRDELLAWLRGILIKDLQQTHRHYHAQKRHVDRELPLREGSGSRLNLPLIDHQASPSQVAQEREQEERLYRAMQQLSDPEREVLQLRNWERLPFAEIGNRMNRSADAARKLWSRAIVRLQRLMESEGS